MADKTIEKIKDRLKVLSDQAAAHQQQIWESQWRLEAVQAVIAELQQFCNETPAPTDNPEPPTRPPATPPQQQKPARTNGRRMKPVPAILQVLKDTPDLDTAAIIAHLEGVVISKAKHFKNTIYTTLYNMKKRGLIVFDDDKRTYRLN